MDGQHHLQAAADANPTSVALIVGATGMAGVSLAEALKLPTAPGAPWVVYGAASRPPPSWFPASAALDGFVQVDALDAGDTREKLSPLSGRVTHLFWVARQSLGSEEANVAANTAMLANVLDALVASTPGSGRLRHVSLQTGTRHYMGPIFDPAFAQHFTLLREPPFREEYPRLPFPCFYYDQEDLLASHPGGFTWSVHRSSVIFGASSRSTHNSLLTLSAYATICRHEGSPFRFPGTAYTWGHFCDASDASQLAGQQIWAATTPAARNQAFNCTNGDVVTWKSLWRALADALAVEFVPFSPGDEEEGEWWAGRMREKGPVWDAIVETHGLHRTRLEDVTCFEAAQVVMNFPFQHVSSMNKSRGFGFHGYVDTLKSVRKWVQRYRDMNILPQI
uniref:Uncharacterized protein C757.02c n=1 Tax=Anthurium amnicola TaxID=1678845 RepID=A0A1D1YKE0_9ARAE